MTLSKSIHNNKKYYLLEDYLFKEVSQSFHQHHCLEMEEFFAIVMWKRKPSAALIANQLIKRKLAASYIKSVTKRVYLEKDPKQKMQILIGTKGGIKGVGNAIASAILTVCYEDEFTIIDYHVLNSLKTLEIKINGNPEESIDDYLEYLEVCKKLADDEGLTLRNLDRALWAMDWYEGKNGLKKIVEKVGIGYVQ